MGCEKNCVVARGLFLGHSHHTTGNNEMHNSIEIRICKPRNEYLSDGI